MTWINGYRRPISPASGAKNESITLTAGRFLTVPRQCVEHVGAADDTDQPTVAHDRRAFHSAAAHQRCQDVDRRLFSDSDDRAGHDIARLQMPGSGDLLQARRVFSEEPQPPAAWAARGWPAKQVPFADNADHALLAVDDGHRADLVPQQ